MTNIGFKAWPKTPRLNRAITITEKIDGTNAAIQIHRLASDEDAHQQATAIVLTEDDGLFQVLAQSRKRIITPGRDTDNQGFAGWVAEHCRELVDALGEGIHYGEWWGHGIQRGYGMPKGVKRFSLFNVNRYAEAVSDQTIAWGLDVVPTIVRSEKFSLDVVDSALLQLSTWGSIAAPEYDNPEGVIVFHEAAQQVFKVTLDNDGQPKGLVQA